jgi:hypothetical protein
MKMVKEFKKIDDMLDYYYLQSNLVGPGEAELKKALTTSTTGIFTTTYGPRAFVQLNQETNVFGVLPKFTSGKKGYRATTARPSALQGGTAEGGDLAAASDDTRTIVTVGDKLQQITYQFSEVLALREGKDDQQSVDDVRRLYQSYHVEGVEASLNTDGDTLASNNFESIDRVTASAALASAMSWTAGDEDIYGIDRSANPWSDAQVSHNSGTDRALTLSLMRGVLYDCRDAGGQTNSIITGWDTYEKLVDLLQTQQRFVEKIVNVGVHGIGPSKPGEANTSVLSFDGVPVFPNTRTVKDTISRVYFLDSTNPEGANSPRLGFRLLRPPTNIESNDFIKNGAFAIKGNFSTVGELYCRFLAAQGSLRDLL